MSRPAGVALFAGPEVWDTGHLRRGVNERGKVPYTRILWRDVVRSYRSPTSHEPTHDLCLLLKDID